jgi:hypothetical protein
MNLVERYPHLNNTKKVSELKPGDKLLITGTELEKVMPYVGTCGIIRSFLKCNGYCFYRRNCSTHGYCFLIEVGNEKGTTTFASCYAQLRTENNKELVKG